MKLCQVEGCDRPLLAKSMCNMHYKRVARNGSTEKLERVSPTFTHRICTACGIEKEIEFFYKRGTGFAAECKPCYGIRQRGATLLRKFGLTLEQYDEMLAAQDGCCSICKSDATIEGHSFDVDHDHKTGKVRGILCRTCNLMLGAGKDDPDILYAGWRYLLEHQ